MGKIPQQKLQRVLAGRERERGFGLAATKVQMLGIFRHRLTEVRQGHIHQQMVVASLLKLGAGGRHAPWRA